jgi:2-amino-4-hydroxy-6-hydroxymethyldihydropteridine diphosphokinase
VEYADWAPQYKRIRDEFGFPPEREARAADRLEELLPPTSRTDPLGRVRARLADRDAVVVGLAPHAGPPPIWKLPAERPTPQVVAADGATEVCLGAAIVPAVIVTDLDGPVPAEIAANRRGSLAVVHAHGDNVPALSEWVPQFPGELAGSWSGPPRAALLDVGGFTDGDRAAFLAEHVGARRILLWGFDFDSVDERDADARERKRAKLGWAREMLGVLARHAPGRLFVWKGDGTIVAYPGISEASTR